MRRKQPDTKAVNDYPTNKQLHRNQATPQCKLGISMLAIHKETRSPSGKSMNASRTFRTVAIVRYTQATLTQYNDNNQASF